MGGQATWRQADAQALPFEPGSFDLVVCSFVMFMPDKQAAYREARRVLRREGRFLFTVWTAWEREHPLMHVADETAAALFPEDPPRFLARTPCGYHDRPRIERDLRAAGFTSVRDR